MRDQADLYRTRLSEIFTSQQVTENVFLEYFNGEVGSVQTVVVIFMPKLLLLIIRI